MSDNPAIYRYERGKVSRVKPKSYLHDLPWVEGDERYRHEVRTKLPEMKWLRLRKIRRLPFKQRRFGRSRMFEKFLYPQN